MNDSVSSEQNGSLSTRRTVALVLVGLLLVSAVGGVVGSSGIAAGQRGGSGGGNTTTNATTTPANATTTSGGDGSDSPDPFGSGNFGVGGDNSPNASTRYDDPNSTNPRDAPVGGNNSPNTSYEYNGSSRNAPVDPNGTNRTGLDINIPNIMDIKLSSIAESFIQGAADILGTVYDLAFSTPVPENDGWRGIFGEPTNATGSGQNGTNATNGTGSPQNATNATGPGQNGPDSWEQVLGISSDRTFQQLHQQLLMDRLYPVLNRVLGIAVVVLGLSLTVNPFMSRFRIIDLMIKFATFLFLYAFSWGAITLMHGVVNDITMWLRPSPTELEALITSIDELAIGSAAAFFVGSGGILSTVFGMGLELAVRHLALLYFFPYVFPVLVLILYLSPWQRLKQFASMGIWQYVNVLTMVIPMAVFLKAAAIVEFSPTNGIAGMIVLVALFVLAVIVPAIQTYFFIQMPGTGAWAAKSAGSAVASRLGIGGGDDDDSADSSSSADSTATGNASPAARTDEAVEASLPSESGVPSSGGLSSNSVERMDPAGNSETTAAQVRALDKEQHCDPNNADAKYEAYVKHGDRSGPRRTTMNAKLAD